MGYTPLQNAGRPRGRRCEKAERVQPRTIPRRILNGPAIVALCLVLPAGACSVRVFVDAPQAVSEEAEALRAGLGSPLSRGTPSVRPVGDRHRADIVLHMEYSWSGEGSPGSPESFPIVWRRPYAPAVRIGGPGSSSAELLRDLGRAVSFEDFRSGAMEIRPLESIRPPWVALPVDGRTADQPGYPLFREARVRVEPVGRRGRRHEDSVRAALVNLVANGTIPSDPTPEILWIAAAGDLMTGRGIDHRLLERGADAVFDVQILRVLRDSDLATANLEGTLTSGGVRAEKRFTFRSPPAVAEVLADAGLDILLLANNHSLDRGTEGLSDTRAALEDAGLAGLGAGADIEEAARPYRELRKGQALAVYGAASFPRERSGWDGAAAAAGPGRAGILWLDAEGFNRIRTAFREDTLDLVLIHGGEEWSRTPSREFRRTVTDLVRAGADVVLGSHPHVVQGMDWIDGRPVFWSLGNFVFPGMDGTPGGEEGLLVRAGFLEGRMLYVQTLPLTLSAEGVRAARR